MASLGEKRRESKKEKTEKREKEIEERGMEKNKIDLDKKGRAIV